jgi:hypothetical protein
MALTRGSFRGYEYDRMVILFSMIDGQKEIPCAISTSALDDLESLARSKPDLSLSQTLSRLAVDRESDDDRAE